MVTYAVALLPSSLLGSVLAVIAALSAEILMVELKSVGRQRFIYDQNFGKVLLTAALRSGCSMHAFVFDAFDL